MKRILIAIVALAVVVSACGGSDSGDAFSDGNGNGDAGGGTVAISGDLDLPDDFPSDFYIPEAMDVQSIFSNPGANSISLTGTFEEGEADEVQADMVRGLRDAGYEFLTDDEDIAVLIKDGVGRVRIRTRVLFEELTTTVDIDRWNDNELDELRALFAEERIVPGRATAQYGGETLTAEGECQIKGPKRIYYSDNAEITIQIDETRDPVHVYADVTTPEGFVWTFDESVSSSHEASDQRLFASGQMYDWNGDEANVDFTIEATCDA